MSYQTHPTVTVYLSSPATDPDTVTVMLDPTAYPSKPAKGSYAYPAISKALAQTREELTVEDLAQRLTQGHSFAPGVFDGGIRDRAHWVGQQVFALDFDDGYTPFAFLEDCTSVGIRPAFIYPSFSDTPQHRKFRAVFVCDQVITDIRLRDFTQRLLMRMFTTPDHAPDAACKDPARYFLGTNTPPVYESYASCINPIGLLDAYLRKQKRVDSAHYADFLRKLAADLGIRLRKRGIGVEVIDYFSGARVEDAGEFTVGIYTANNTQTCFSPEHPNSSLVRWNDTVVCIRWATVSSPPAASQSTHTPAPSRRKREEPKEEFRPGPRLTEKDKKELLDRCQLLHEFISGKEHIGHQGRRLLLTNLRQREGGVAWYRKGLTSRNDYRPDTLLEDAKRYNMQPEGCRNCLYARTCEHKTNLLQQLGVKRRECRQTAPAPVGIPVEETRQYLEQAIREALEANDRRVHVIRCDTGVGKTEVLLRQSLENTCIAFPTHRLKDEAYQRYRQARNEEAFVWPDRPALPEDIGNLLRHGYAIGQPATRSLLLRALKAEAVQADPVWQQSIQDYLEAMQTIHRQTCIFSTHEKALQVEHLPRLVFDEDLLRSLIRVDEVRPEDVERLRQHLRDKKEDVRMAAIDAHLKAVLQAPSRVVQANDGVSYSQEVLHRLLLEAGPTLSSPIESLFTGRACIKDRSDPTAGDSLFAIQCRALPADATVVVLSATADQSMYEAVFGQRLVFHDLSQTRRLGRLVLHPGKGYSKQSIAKARKEFVEQVKKDQQTYGFEGIITHKFVQQDVQQAGIPVLATFGALEGLDAFGGKDIAIYGTPFPPEYVYKLYAHLLGLSADMDDFEFAERPVVRNGFEFSFPTCSPNPALQRLHLSLIESELLQAVGRARLVNHACTVHLFSSLPLAGGELVKV